MKTENAPTRTATYLAKYAPPDWVAPDLHLNFELDPENTRVTARARFERNPAGRPDAPLVLHGEAMKLESILMNGRKLDASEYRIDSDSHTLTLPADAGDTIELEIVTLIAPAANTALEGLYMSGGKFCTQCEAQGFRRIVYFLDRPDVMARYTTTIVGNRAEYPLLLSNGNPVERTTLPDGRHRVTWVDPFPKPTYLFALVAGNLGCVKDRFVTRSGRSVALEIYVDHGNEDRADFAMASLKEAMAWDERTFGREYDLDIFMIVAVDDFNMGAMENKGLNVFNSKLVLANPRTATDDAFEFIQAVIGHEYFHNWTGNRVTCRDWFQLTLKEGLTVYRDQRFTEDMTHAAIKRIKDVCHLRAHQFPEDAGPMSHPIQPKSYIEINNFYTMTVYEKGAEVIRMIATLIGRDAFRRGMDIYFERNDGRAVTVEEFVAAMEAGSGMDLGQFRRWYDQNGTPELRVLSEQYDAARSEYTLELEQSNPMYVNTLRADAGGQSAGDAGPGADSGPDPLMIPVALGLLAEEGQSLALDLEGHEIRAGVDSETTLVVPMTGVTQRLRFRNVPVRPVLSILRGYSAPVKLTYERDRASLSFLLAHDPDLFNRWEAGQQLMKAVIADTIQWIDEAAPAAGPATLSIDDVEPLLAGAFRSLLAQEGLDPAYLSLALDLPQEAELTAEQQPARYAATHAAVRAIRRALALANRDRLLELYHLLHNADVSDAAQAIGNRRLKNLCLVYLMATRETAIAEICFEQQKTARTMTDETAALYLLADSDSALRSEGLRLFYERWHGDSLVIDHWFSSQALSTREDTPGTVASLRADPVFSLRNPNKVRALFGAFSRNGVRFNSAEGYSLLASTVLELDAFNPGVAARLARAFNEVARLEPDLQGLARAELERILGAPKISNDVYEVVSRSLRFA